MEQGTTTRGRTSHRIHRPHWSYSQLNQYLRCPLQYYFERVLKLPRTFSPSGMALGSAVHEGLATYHRDLQDRREPAAETVKQSFLARWEEAEAEHPVQYRNAETKDDVQQQGLALLDTYLAEPPPQNILAVEQPLVVPLLNSQGEILEKPILAVLDLLSREEDNRLTVHEFKTSGRRYGQSETDTTLQATCYGHAVQERYDEQPAIRYTVLVKTKKPSVQRLETVRSPSDSGRLGDIVQGVERALEAKAVYPIESPLNGSSCAYRSPCRDWTGTATRDTSEINTNNFEELATC